jgi:hypothetical protein
MPKFFGAQQIAELCLPMILKGHGKKLSRDSFYKYHEPVSPLSLVLVIMSFSKSFFLVPHRCHDTRVKLFVVTDTRIKTLLDSWKVFLLCTGDPYYVLYTALLIS